MMESIEDGRRSLIETIEQVLGHPLSSSLREAFLQVSRAYFVPVHLKQVRPGEWIPFETKEMVYQDRPFTTKVNEKRMPCSSSSQPSIMAAMLEALDVRTGMKVLEVGTGTGYNAALLSVLVGKQGHVITIDVDPNLVQIASQRLKEAEYMNVCVRQADALEAIPNGLYDRIILTGGYPKVLDGWINHLAEGGRMVGNLLGTLATPLFCVIKQENEVPGSVLPTPGFFMSLYRDSDTEKDTIAPGARIDLVPLLALPLIECGRTTTFVDALDDLSLRLFLDVHLPGIQMRPHYLGISHKGSPPSFATCLVYAQSLAMFSPEPLENDAYLVEVRGSFPLWSHLQEFYRQWLALKPPINQYKMCFEGERSVMILPRESRSN